MRKHGFNRIITRRDFLKIAAASLGSLSLSPWMDLFKLEDFPQAERLGRVCVGTAEIKAAPSYEAETLGTIYEDMVFPWIKEVVGRWPYRNNQRWVETPDGYIWSPFLQPVENNPPVRSAWWRYRESNGQTFRFYFSQILWVDQIKTEADGSVWYRINERYGNPGDAFWCPAEAFRPITPDEVAPIHPDVDDKRVEVDINWGVQTLSCYEGNSEVYFCRISSGQEQGSTPLSPFPSPGFQIWRKLFSLHMGGSTAAGSWDVPGVGWTSLFVGEGVAIHSTYWHNNYGEPMSHGCVNVSPEDAKWIFRWTQPSVPFESGDITIVGEGSTRVIVDHW